jgi:Spy/CpxP family protein refolding chaperone
MKKYLVYLAVVALSPGLSLFAEGPGDGSKPPKHGPKPPPWEELQDQLGLSADQLQKLQVHREAQKAKIGVIRDDSTLNKEQKREKMRSIMQSGRSEIESILTPAQLEKMKQLRMDRKAKKQNKTPDTATPAPTT